MKAAPRLDRTAVLVLGLYLTGTGGVALWQGQQLYTDYLGLRVPATSALLTGVVLLLIGTALWRRVPWDR